LIRGAPDGFGKAGWPPGCDRLDKLNRERALPKTAGVLGRKGLRRSIRTAAGRPPR